MTRSWLTVLVVSCFKLAGGYCYVGVQCFGPQEVQGAVRRLWAACPLVQPSVTSSASSANAAHQQHQLWDCSMQFNSSMFNWQQLLVYFPL